jgi:hypothetical protein
VQIYEELAGSTAAAFKLEQSWTRLGILLAEFKAKEHWRQYEQYKTFDDFILELRQRFNRGRTVLYGYMGAVETLLPTISAETLETIGISKVLELKRAQKKLGGKVMPPELLEAALKPDVTTKELRGTVGKALNLTEEPGGTWFDLDGFFMDKAERAEFKEAFLATEGLLGLKSTTPDHIRRKEVILTWMREWFGTHAAEFNGVEQPPNVAPIYISPEILKDAGFQHPFISQIPKDRD